MNAAADKQSSLLSTALKLLHEGKLAECQRACHEVLEHQNSDPRAHHILALAYRAQGNLKTAEASIQTALTYTQKDPSLLNTYGLILMDLGKVKEAIATLKGAIIQDEKLAAAHANLGHCHMSLSNAAEAESCYKEALSISPQATDALVQLALLLRGQGRLHELSKLIDHHNYDRNADAGVLLVKGLLALDGNNFAQAEIIFRHALKLMPNSAVIWGNYGLALAKQDNMVAARDAYERAIGLDPGLVEARINIADTYKYDAPKTAREHLQKALDLKPNDPVALDMSGYTWFIEGELESAAKCYDDALLAFPNFDRAAYHRSGIHFLRGELAEAWEIYKRRYTGAELPGSPVRENIPLWSAETNLGPNTLLWTDQGIGDEILQLSLIADIHTEGVSITLAATERLVPIIKRSFPNINCVSHHDVNAGTYDSTGIDAQYPVVLLAQKLRRSFKDFPNRLSYLEADQERAERVRDDYRKRNDGKPLIGISWKSNSTQSGIRKSISIDKLIPLLSDPKYTFVVLQYGDVRSDIESLPSEIQDRVILDERVKPLTDMESFSSQVAAMDAVVTTSSTTAHLSGALGIPTWTLVPKIGPGWLWYWFDKRSDSPWYPSLTLHRQEADGTWDKAILNTTQEVYKLLHRPQGLQ